MKFSSALLFFIVLSFHLAFAQSITDAKLDNRQSVLNGRAYFSFPTSAVNMQRPVDIMSIGPNPNEETRIVYSVDKMRLVFFAQELYLVSDKNLFNEINSDSAYKANYTSRIFTDKDSLFSILSTPLRYDSTQAGIIVQSLLVQTPDSCIFRIDAYINACAFAKRADFQALAESVFKTLEKGTRRNKRNERDEKYLLADSTQSFLFHLPVNYCVTIDQQYDFETFKFHKFRYFNDNTWADMLIYVGMHPAYTFMDYGLDEKAAKKESGTFLGAKMDWLFFNYDMQGIFLKEQMLPHEELGRGIKVHVAMLTNKQESFVELTKMVEEVKVVGR